MTIHNNLSLLPLAVAIILTREYAASAFSISNHPIRTTTKKSFWKYPRDTRLPLPLRSTQMDEMMELGGRTSPDSTRKRLREMRDKQLAELKETEALLEVLEGGGDDNTVMKEWMSPFEQSIKAAENYGFLSRSEGSPSYDTTLGESMDKKFEGYAPPRNVLRMAKEGFKRNIKAIFGEYEESIKLTTRQKELQKKIESLTLNCTAVWEREEEVEAPWVLKIPYIFLCYMLDVVFEGRSVFSRFFLLETVARMPYFSYISMLLLYETLGWWRRSADVKRTHFSEEWNEYHHLMIMESLGGDQEWWVRALAQHAAIAYYFTLVGLWFISPTLGYQFSEMLETHAVATYSQFIDENREALEELPPPSVAVEYYSLGANDPLFADYQKKDRSKNEQLYITSLLDAFEQIRRDEGDHVSTMQACLDPEVAVLSPSAEKKFLFSVAMIASIGAAVINGNDLDLSTLSFEGLESITDDVISMMNENIPESERLFSNLAQDTESVLAGSNPDAIGDEETLAATLAAEGAIISIGFEQIKASILELIGRLL